MLTTGKSQIGLLSPSELSTDEPLGEDVTPVSIG